MNARAPAALVLLALLAMGTAAAHGFPIGGEPEPYALLDDAPARVVVHMSEPIEPAFSRVHVYDAQGVDRAVGDAYAADGNASRLGVDVETLDNGTYTVAWEARWISDGHDTKGSYGFAVGNATFAQDDLGARTEFAGPDATEVALRALLFMGAFASAGAILFHLAVDRGVTGAVGARRAQRFALYGASAVALATFGLLLRLTASGYRTSLGGAFPLLAQSVTQTQLGGVLAVRLLLALTLALLFALTLRQASRTTLLAGGGLAVPVLATLSLTSHAAGDGVGRALLLDLAHVLAGAAWVGGLPLLVAGLLAVGRAQPTAGGDTAGAGERLAHRFSRLAMAASLVVVVTGSLEGLERLGGELRALVDTPYGRVLLAKVALVGVLLLFGAWNHFVLIPRMKRRPGDEWRRLARTSASETVLAALVLVAAGALTGMAPEPPVAAAQGPFLAEGEGEDVRATLLVTPYRLGVNQFQAQLEVLSNGTPLDYAKNVELFLNYEGDAAGGEDLGTAIVPLEHAGDGTYVGRGSLGLPGAWSATVFVQRPDAYDDAVTFELEVA